MALVAHEMNDRSAELFCPNPFEWLDVTAWDRADVKFSLCIESWGGDAARLCTMPIAAAAEIDLDAWYNTLHTRAIREAQAAGFAEFCARCPRRRDAAPPVVPATAGVREKYAALAAGPLWPKSLNLAYDKSCNLACPSCRTAAIVERPGSPHYAALERFQDRVIKPLVRRAETVCLAGLGDPFGSPLYFALLTSIQPEEAPDLHWYILTNGLGFTPENYEKIPTRGRIRGVQVSIDAASEEVYRLNRGGSWPRLLDNLVFLSSLRHAGRIGTLDISMVVQENNWGQIHEFAQMGVEFGVDRVQYNALLQQGQCSSAEYRRRAVHREGHPLRRKLLAALEDVRRQAAGLEIIVEMPRGDAPC
jgi:hypothetical protein